VIVEFKARGEIHPLSEGVATGAAQGLRLRGTSGREDYGVEGARELAEAIELRLTEACDDPIVLDGEQAEALFYYLNGTAMLSAGDPRNHEAYPLYVAVRAMRDQRHPGHDFGPSPP
jgi:hypothetical protein